MLFHVNWSPSNTKSISSNVRNRFHLENSDLGTDVIISGEAENDEV